MSLIWLMETADPGFQKRDATTFPISKLTTMISSLAQTRDLIYSTSLTSMRGGSNLHVQRGIWGSAC